MGSWILLKLKVVVYCDDYDNQHGWNMPIKAFNSVGWNWNVRDSHMFSTFLVPGKSAYVNC